MGRKLILGLGNPGDAYRDTRHNVGFRVVEELARRRNLRLGTRECSSRMGLAGDLILALPQAYMNRSGYAARCLVERYALDLADLLVVYDDVHLPLGRLRLRPGGSPGGHRGMASVIESLRSSAIPRLRLGVLGEAGAPTGEDLADFVLAPFRKDEEAVAEEMIQRAAEACTVWCEAGVAVAMNRFNG